MPVSCHFRDCKALLVTSLTHVSGAITSVQTFTFNRHGSKEDDYNLGDCPVGGVGHLSDTEGTLVSRYYNRRVGTLYSSSRRVFVGLYV